MAWPIIIFAVIVFAACYYFFDRWFGLHERLQEIEAHLEYVHEQLVALQNDLKRKRTWSDGEEV